MTRSTVAATPANISGLAPSGLNAHLRAELETAVKEKFLEYGKHVYMAGLRLIPSTRVDLDQGNFEVMGYAIVAEIMTDGNSAPKRSFDAVVSVAEGDGSSQTVKVQIPYLRDL